MALLGLTWTLACSPRHGRIENALLATINETCPIESEPCQIDLTSVAFADWDSMVVFATGADRFEVNKVLGVNAVRESQAPVSLVVALRNDGKLVYIEDDPRKVEGYSPNDIQFDWTDGGRFVVYSKDALFNVARYRVEGGFYYVLNCISGCLR